MCVPQTCTYFHVEVTTQKTQSVKLKSFVEDNIVLRQEKEPLNGIQLHSIQSSMQQAKQN